MMMGVATTHRPGLLYDGFRFPLEIPYGVQTSFGGAMRSSFIVSAATAFGLVLGACNSSGGSSVQSPATPAVSPASTGQSTGTTARGSTYEVVPDSAVTAGLSDVQAQAIEIKSVLGTNQAEAKALVRQMYDSWFLFEGTVRTNDKNLYLEIEDGLAAIKAGVEQNDPSKVDKGLADLKGGASAYLAKHP